VVSELIAPPKAGGRLFIDGVLLRMPFGRSLRRVEAAVRAQVNPLPAEAGHESEASFPCQAASERCVSDVRRRRSARGRAPRHVRPAAIAHP
jgi:hypothetical protein